MAGYVKMFSLHFFCLHCFVSSSFTLLFSVCYIVKVFVLILHLKFLNFWILHILSIALTVMGGPSAAAVCLLQCCYFSFCPSWRRESKGQIAKERERENRVRIMVYRPWLWKIECPENEVFFFFKSHLSFRLESSLWFNRDSGDKSWIPGSGFTVILSSRGA